MSYVLVPIGDGSVSVAVESSDPPAPATGPPADPAHQVAAKNVRRLPHRDAPDSDNVKGHAA